MSPIRGGFSAYSSGPIFDTTPKDPFLSNVCGTCMITDAGIQNTPYGPPYQTGLVKDTTFAEIQQHEQKKD